MRSRRALILFALGTLMAVQLVLLHEGRSVGPVYGPVRDEVFPTIPIAFLDERQELALRDVVSRNTGCTLLVIMDVDCAVCQRMRMEWPQRFQSWADSLRISIQAIWLVAEPEEVTIQFFGNYGAERVHRGRVVADFNTALSVLGVIGTPTQYLIDHKGVLRLGIAGDQLPSQGEAERICVD